jgi:hypothetical protein
MELVAQKITKVIRSGCILVSIACNSFAMSYQAAIPIVGVAAGIAMPLFIAATTFAIGHAVRKRSR